MKKAQSGFTLLELMIGIIIVAILASIAIPSFGKAIEKTKVKDAQTTLSAIYSAEKIYRLDDTNSSYGALTDLIDNHYITDPDPGGNNNTSWDFSAVGGATFTATAKRTGGGYNDKTITVDQNFSGQPNTSPGYGGRTYAGSHNLRD